MKSVTRTVPSWVSHSLSMISVSSRYARRVAAPVPTGAMRQCPADSSSSNAAKQAVESKRGRHNQSMLPFRPSNAAVCRSPSTA